MAYQDEYQQTAVAPNGVPMYPDERAQWQQRALDAGFTPQELPATFAPSPAFPKMTVNPMSEYRIPEQPVYLPRETPKLTFDQPMTMGYWVSPQTGIPYNRNDFDGSLVRWGNQSGVPSSQRDLDAHRAQWAQQDASGAAGGMVPIGGNISALADARQRLINAHGMVPLQMSGQQPQLAMGMAEQIYGGGALGNHPIQHTDYWNNRYTQRQAQAADRLGIAQNVAMLPLERRQRMENAMMQSQQAIGGSWAGHAMPVSGVATMTDKQAEDFYSHGAEAESQRTGIPLETIIAWRRLGFLNEKARLLRGQPKPEAPLAPGALVPVPNRTNEYGQPIYTMPSIMPTQPQQPSAAAGTTQAAPTQSAPQGKVVIQNGHRYRLSPDGKNAEYLGVAKEQ